MDDSSEKRVRRPRYNGRNPRHFSDKYKELNPEKFPDQVEKAIERGQTPAGMHRPIMVREILEALQLSPGQVVLDCTVGYGGHAEAILNTILPGGKLLGIDADPIELPKTELRLRAHCLSSEDLVLRRMNYAGAAQFVAEHTSNGVDGLLADLGISSMQFDNPDRGFGFKVDGPLDMRINPRRGKSAADWLSSLSGEELIQVFRLNADEPNAEKLSRAILDSHSIQPIETTFSLVEIVRRNCQQLSKEDTESTIRRVFQAIRIAVNDEFGCLDTMLGQLPTCMKPGGRIAILSFHSGEDRRVKAAFKKGLQNGDYSFVSPELLRPSMAEQRSNVRCRSAKLRVAIRS